MKCFDKQLNLISIACLDNDSNNISTNIAKPKNYIVIYTLNYAHIMPLTMKNCSFDVK